MFKTIALMFPYRRKGLERSLGIHPRFQSLLPTVILPKLHMFSCSQEVSEYIKCSKLNGEGGVDYYLCRVRLFGDVAVCGAVTHTPRSNPSAMFYN